MPKKRTLSVKGVDIGVMSVGENDFISLTDMLKAKDGDFFISDWLRNRNTVEYIGIWESIHNPSFNYGEFAIIKGQAGLNRDGKAVPAMTKAKLCDMDGDGIFELRGDGLRAIIVPGWTK